ncbi:MAG: chorismate mutase [Bacillota bacterium]|jgi:chorismate mutase|nr:chorismate mutase [Bacillota bacterium]MDK2855728.1 chorismate mutase [Bacillota bacterium]MDK2924692.1 chorismate mutase [Bacillota bacterium]
MAKEEATFYLVREEALPEVLHKTIKAKDLLKQGVCSTVNEAVQRVGLSRAAYYKYRNYIFPFYDLSRGKIVTIYFLLEHRPGVLSQILTRIAQSRGNILTINQGIPLQGVANVSISIETQGMSEDIETLVNALSKLDGVRKTEIVGQS